MREMVDGGLAHTKRPPASEPGIGLVAGYAFFSAPYEDVRLKGR